MSRQNNAGIGAPEILHPFVAWARNNRYISRLHYHEATIYRTAGNYRQHFLYYTWDALLDSAVVYDCNTQRFYDVTGRDWGEGYETLEQLIAAIEAETAEDEIA